MSLSFKLLAEDFCQHTSARRRPDLPVEAPIRPVARSGVRSTVEDALAFDEHVIRDNALRFSRTTFMQRFRETVEACWREHVACRPLCPTAPFVRPPVGPTPVRMARSDRPDALR